MPMLTFTTHARVKCAACHCDLMATWNERYYTMEVTPCYDCLANAKRNALEDRIGFDKMVYIAKALNLPIPFKEEYTSPLKHEPADEDDPDEYPRNKCGFCGEYIDFENEHPRMRDRHKSCARAEKAEYLSDAKKDGGA